MPAAPVQPARVGSPVGGSTFTTSAPRSARDRVASGPARKVVRSIFNALSSRYQYPEQHHQARAISCIDDMDGRSDKHTFEFGHIMEEVLNLGFGGEAHHALDSGPIVPASIEQYDFAGGRKV